MKNFIVIVILSFISLGIGAQQPSFPENKNINLAASIVFDNVTNYKGGIETGTTLLSLFDFSIDFKFNENFLRNTSLHAHVLKTAGNSSSEKLIGDIQVASNIDGYASHFIYELLLKQQIANFSITAGMHDLNSEFMFSEFAGDFINSSFGIAPAVTLNVPVSVFPVTTFGGLLAYENDKLLIKSGLYNLNHDYIEEESFNFQNHFFQHGFINVTEIAYRSIKKNIKGEYKIGGYLKQCDQYQHENLPEDCFSKINYGLYFIGDKTLKEFHKGQLLGTFVQLSIAPNSTNFASEYFGAGLSIRELSSKWLPNQIGLAIGTVKLNNYINSELIKSDKYETVIELTAQIPAFKFFTIQPDFQYICNPSRQYNNSFTGIIRLIMEFN